MYCTSPFISSVLPLPPKTKPKSCHVSPRMSLNSSSPNPNPKNPNPNLVAAITGLLWGNSLPPQLLISTVRTSWSAAWHLMMSQLAPSDPSGRYTRPTSRFRTSQFRPSKPLSLHLYAGLPCPGAHRTLIVRALKGLEAAMPVSIASPGMDGSWEFRNSSVPIGDKLIPSSDNANRCRTLREVYKLRRGGYDGRSTVPMLWDADKKEIVCNESYDIIELFNSGLNEFSRNPELDLSPPSMKNQIDEWNRIIYPNVNNGVYR